MLRHDCSSRRGRSSSCSQQGGVREDTAETPSLWRPAASPFSVRVGWTQVSRSHAP